MVAFILFFATASFSAPTPELTREYEIHCILPSDINEHLPRLKELAEECSSAVEIGVRELVSTWAILQGLAESGKSSPKYVGIDLTYPQLERFFDAKRYAGASGIQFEFVLGNDIELDIEPTDLLFIDSWHTYVHLTFELEKFSPKVRKYIAMHDTSEPWGDEDEPSYYPTNPPYPDHINREKRGLWPAVVDFLKTHPEWRLKERHFNNHGFTVLERVEEKN